MISSEIADIKHKLPNYDVRYGYVAFNLRAGSDGGVDIVYEIPFKERTDNVQLTLRYYKSENPDLWGYTSAPFATQITNYGFRANVHNLENIDRTWVVCYIALGV